MTNDFTDKQREMWRLAKYAADRTKRKSENFERPIIIPPDWYYRQWTHEAGNNFDSEMAKLDNNYGGLKRQNINNFVAGLRNLPNRFLNWAGNLFTGRR